MPEIRGPGRHRRGTEHIGGRRGRRKGRPKASTTIDLPLPVSPVSRSGKTAMESNADALDDSVIFRRLVRRSRYSIRL